MTKRRIVARASLAHLVPTFNAIRRREGVTADRPAAVAKEVSIAREQVSDNYATGDRVDMTDVPFVTIDPEGSRDLDQAFFIARTNTGWRVRYAIADVASHVQPGGAIDRDAWKRAETVYCPDVRVGLHPPTMSEGFASLLPGQRTKAVVWDMAVGADGSLGLHDLRRAWVRSRRQYAYGEVEHGTSEDATRLGALLAEVGDARRAAMARTGAISLPKPSQEVTSHGGHLQLEFRAANSTEDDNAHISLMTGMIAARLMIEAGMGVLRTMPPASADALVRLRRQAEAMDVPWPANVSYSELLPSIDPASPQGAAFLTAAVALFRGAQWEPFAVADGLPVPKQAVHGALGAPYAHVTAPLRRLVDRYGTEVCLAHVEGRSVPRWVVEALPRLGDAMAAGTATSGRVDRACVDAVETAVLSTHLGREFEGVGLDERTVQLAHPAVIARCDGEVAVGRRQTVRLVSADLERGTRFEVVGGAPQ